MRLVWLSRTKFLSADNSLKGYLNSFCCVDERKSVKLIYGISAEKRGQSSNSFAWAKAVSKRKKNACVPGSQSQGFDMAPAQQIRDPISHSDLSLFGDRHSSLSSSVITEQKVSSDIR